MNRALFALALATTAGCAFAQEPAATPPPAPAVAAPAAACCAVPTGTPIYIELAQELSSKTALRGDSFGLKLVDPIKVDGQVVVPAGTPGRGEVVDAAKAGMGGKPGELVLAARYLKLGDRQIPLRSFKLGGHGVNNGHEAQNAVLLVGVVGLAMRGGDMVLPVGAEASAKIASDITLPPMPDAGAKDEKAKTP